LNPNRDTGKETPSVTPRVSLERMNRDRRHRRLLRRALRGDERALSRLYRELWTPLHRYVAARELPREDVEDIVAQVFTRFLERMDRYDPRRGGVCAWLLGIARHALIDHYRRRRPDTATHAPLEELARHAGDPAPDPLENLIEQEEARLASGVLAGHPAETRELFALRYGQGLSHREIASLTGLGEAAVRQRFSRVMREIRERHDRGQGTLNEEGEVDYA